MAEEVLLSPGVLTIENDQSFISQQPVQAGAAIIGPTVKGPVGIPTVVTTYSEYLNKFGDIFISGSQTYSYLTSISAYNYFNNGGATLLVTRVVSASNDWTSATSSLIPSSTAATSASANINLTYISASVASVGSSSFNVNGITFFFTGSTVSNTSTVIYVNTASFAASTATDYAVTASTVFTFSSSVAPYSASLLNISSSTSTSNITFTYVGQNGLLGNLQYVVSGSTTTFFSGGTNTEAFVLETLSEGEIMNSTSTPNADGTLPSGSIDNLRWQIISPNVATGTFSLVIRRGDDSTNSPTILETWGPLSLDPFSSNYIEKAIGNQVESVTQDDGEYYVQLSGNYPNLSKYVRVKQVNTATPNYLDNTGNPKPQYTGSIPYSSNGTFGAAQGNILPSTAGTYYENIGEVNPQGIPVSDYNESINLLANKDAYRFNLITVPGLVYGYPSHVSALSLLISNCQNNGNAMAVIDLTGYGANIATATLNASGLNTSYAATYWPWLKTLDPGTGQQAWVPASTMIPGVYIASDSASEPWFAPAGVNRGVIPNAIMAERYLTQGNRDTLYEANVNPIATFPNTGVTVFGQKTLQKKASALDRVNVRRLLIELKNYISQVADTLVFEQNTIATRNNFLLQVNPYLSSVQQRQGLYSFRVVMDETNNTPQVIDNNQLVGAIYLQPTKTAEFIYLTFNVLPTGASFG
jgi:phage tail sheath protein FI